MSADLKLTLPQSDLKTVGVLGGMGAAEATIEFEKIFHSVSRLLIPQKFSTGYPPLITAYFREVPLKINSNGEIVAPLQANDKLIQLAKQIGLICDFLVILSNTPHFFLNDIEKASGKKVLSMIDVTIEEIKRRKLKRIGIMAIGLTLENRLYQKPLDELGIEYEILPNNISEELDKSIFQVMEGSVNLESKRIAAKSIDYLTERKVGGIILGCTELSLLLVNQVHTNNLLDPVALTAAAAVKKSIGLR